MGERDVPAPADDRAHRRRSLSRGLTPLPGTVFTIGHGARPAPEFVGLVTAAGIGVLADVRRFPGSRRHPQYGRSALDAALADAGVRYEWHGEALGGRRSGVPDSRHTALRNASFVGYADHMDTAAFRDAVVALAERPEVVAVMCAETLWWRCHRSFIADALVLRGVDVQHLVGPGERRAHRPHTTARRGDDGWPVYDVPDTLPLE